MQRACKNCFSIYEGDSESIYCPSCLKAQKDLELNIINKLTFLRHKSTLKKQMEFGTFLNYVHGVLEKSIEDTMNEEFEYLSIEVKFVKKLT